MINRKTLENISMEKLFIKYSFLQEFLSDNLIETELTNITLVNFLENLDEEFIEDNALDIENIIEGAIVYVNQMIEFLGIEDNIVSEITIQPGFNKSGEPETFGELIIKPGEIISIVGPTGSGKSRLLADIEWGAQADTPTKRRILINGKPLDIKERFSTRNRLVAQLSQNMNFVMDLTVEEFLELHAKSRMVENEEEIIQKIFEKANNLAGEKFARDTPVTSLSGGQSRALMIADTAILSTSPIVLIDEIENAGIDRKEALSLLVGEEKIVLIATHDPILALMASKRIIISNGGISKIIDVSEKEKKVLQDLEILDNAILGVRQKLRYGEEIAFDINDINRK